MCPILHFMQFCKHLNNISEEFLSAFTCLSIIHLPVYPETCVILTLLSPNMFSRSCFLCVLFIQPAYILFKGEENLLIPVHAYPVIDDLHIPTRIDLSAVPLGLRCVCVFVWIYECFLTFLLPVVLAVSLYPSVKPTVLPFTRWCQNIEKNCFIFLLFIPSSPGFATLFL